MTKRRVFTYLLSATIIILAVLLRIHRGTAVKSCEISVRIWTGTTFGELNVQLYVFCRGKTPSNLTLTGMRVPNGTILEPRGLSRKFSSPSYVPNSQFDTRSPAGRQLQSLHVRTDAEAKCVEVLYRYKLSEEYLRPFKDVGSSYFCVPLESCVLMPRELVTMGLSVHVGKNVQMLPETFQSTTSRPDVVLRETMLAVGVLPPVKARFGGIIVRSLNSSHYESVTPVAEYLRSLLKHSETTQRFDVTVLSLKRPQRPYEYEIFTERAAVVFQFNGRPIPQGLCNLGERIIRRALGAVENEPEGHWFCLGLPKCLAIEAMEEPLRQELWDDLFDQLLFHPVDALAFVDNPAQTEEAHRILSEFKGPLLCRLLIRQLQAGRGLAPLIQAIQNNQPVTRQSFVKLLNNLYDKSSCVKTLNRLKYAEQFFCENRLTSQRHVMGTSSSSDFPKKCAQKTVISPSNWDILSLVVTKSNAGFLETCGCIADESGGLARRAHFLRSLSKDALIFDLGDFSQRISPSQFGALDMQELREQIRLLDEMGYTAIIPGTLELHLGPSVLKTISLATNKTMILGHLSNGLPLQHSMILQSKNLIIGFIGVNEYGPGPLSVRYTRWATQHAWQDIYLTEKMHAIQLEAQELRSAGAATVVLLGSIAPSTVLSLRAVPEVDLVISRFGAPCLGLKEMSVFAKQLGWEGPPNFVNRELLVLWLPHWEAQGHVRTLDLTFETNNKWQLAASRSLRLSPDIPNDPTIQASLDKFYREAAQNESAKWTGEVFFSGESVEKLPGNRYLGAKACRDCHADQYSSWKKTRHSKAMKAIMDKHRQYYPKCVVCHSTGFGRESGYTLMSSKRVLANVQCEVCHGPGSLHVNDPYNSLLTRRRPKKHHCAQCHKEKTIDFDKEFNIRYAAVSH